MTDSERSPRVSNEALATRLIRAGKTEAPSGRSVQRTLAALGLASAVPGVGTAAAASTMTAKSLTLIGVAKFVVLGATGGAVLLSAAHAVRDVREPGDPPPVQVLVRAKNAAPSKTSAASASSVAPAPSNVFRPQSPSRSTHQKAPSMESKAALAAEVAFIDRAREAFRNGRFADALLLLDGYEQAFQPPRLLPEVLYVRMQAFSRAGEAPRAADLAARLVSEFPKSPHAASARSLLHGPGELDGHTPLRAVTPR